MLHVSWIYIVLLIADSYPFVQCDTCDLCWHNDVISGLCNAPIKISVREPTVNANNDVDPFSVNHMSLNFCLFESVTYQSRVAHSPSSFSLFPVALCTIIIINGLSLCLHVSDGSPVPTLVFDLNYVFAIQKLNRFSKSDPFNSLYGRLLLSLQVAQVDVRPPWSAQGRSVAEEAERAVESWSAGTSARRCVVSGSATTTQTDSGDSRQMHRSERTRERSRLRLYASITRADKLYTRILRLSSLYRHIDRSIHRQQVRHFCYFVADVMLL